MKKLVALLLVVMMLVPSALALGESSDGKVLNFYCWNEEFKTRSRQSKAIVRSGEVTPYANIILCAGVAF